MRLGVSKGMLPLKTTCSDKMLMMAATKHEHQPARRLGWAALAYHKQEGATPDPGPRKHCLQNDGKPDERFGVRVGTWNIGSMSGRGTEVCEEEEDGCVLSARSKVERTRSAVFWREGEKMQVVVVWE